MQNKLKSRLLIFSFITALMFFMGWGCDENPFDVGSEDEPNFRAFASGVNGDVSIAVTVSRDEREPDGGGLLVIGEDEFDFDISGAVLSTDSNPGTPYTPVG